MKFGYKHPCEWEYPLPQEEAVAIEVNGISYAVMMASPWDLEDFAMGFLYTEQLIHKAIDLHDIELRSTEQGIVLQLNIANRRLAALQQKMRHIRGNSGCGICGVSALEYAVLQLEKLPHQDIFTDGLPQDLRQKIYQFQQQTKALTNQFSEAVHAAFWLNNKGDIALCREDIGRHNAVDKLIGALIKSKQDLQAGALLVTSRCSVELVQKAIVAGITTLICFASPSTLAVNTAKRCNLRLIHVPKTDLPILYDQQSSLLTKANA